MELVALLSTGKGTWGQVSGLMKKGEWEKIIILGTSFAKDFNVPGISFEFIEFDSDKSLIPLKKELEKKLRESIIDELFKKSVNPVLELLKTHLSQSGYNLKLFSLTQLLGI